MGVGVKHKLVLKTDHLGWGPCTALLRPQNLIEKLLANYWPPFVSTMWSDLFCGEAFSGCGKREWKAGKLGWTDRALRWPWQEAWAWTKTAMILLPGTRKRDFSAEWIRMWGSVSCQEWGKKGVAFSTLECGQCWTLIEPPTWGKAQFSPRGVGRRQKLDGFSTSPELQPWWGSWSRPQWMIFTFTANPLRSATTEPPEGFVLGMVSVLVPRRWILDSGIFNSRLTTWILEEIFHFSWVRHRPGHIPHGSMYVEPSTPSRDQWQDHESLQPQEVPLV